MSAILGVFIGIGAALLVLGFLQLFKGPEGGRYTYHTENDEQVSIDETQTESVNGL